MKHPTTTQLADLLDEAHHILHQLEHGVPTTPGQHTPGINELLRRAQTAGRDGYPTRTLGGGGGPSSVLDDQGKPMPPVNDPVGELVTSRTIADPIQHAAQTAIRGLTGAIGDLRAARSALANALTPKPEDAALERGCTIHANHGAWEPIYRGDRCRWCYDFWLAEGVNPPDTLTRKRIRGQRITTQDVTQALQQPQRHRAG